MKTILVDIDGTVASYNFRGLIKKYFEVDISLQTIKSYSIEDALGVCPRDVSAMFRQEVLSKPNFIYGATKALREFIANDYEVGIFTNRLKFMTEVQLEDWLYDNKIPFSSIITPRNLPSYVYAHIDDSPEKLMTVVELVTVKKSILFNQPWNKECLNITGKLIRAGSWKAVKEIIDGTN